MSSTVGTIWNHSSEAINEGIVAGEALLVLSSNTECIAIFCTTRVPTLFSLDLIQVIVFIESVFKKNKNIVQWFTDIFNSLIEDSSVHQNLLKNVTFQYLTQLLKQTHILRSTFQVKLLARCSMKRFALGFDNRSYFFV